MTNLFFQEEEEESFYKDLGHEKKTVILTLYGFGTRIDPVSYIAFKLNASPSNIDGPILLIRFLTITY